MDSSTPPSPAPTPLSPEEPSPTFLTVADTLLLRHGLRGVAEVEIRQVGDHPTAGAEVAAFITAEGLGVSFRQIERMMPPPLRRFVFRYTAGRRAEVTVAPDLP